MSEVIFSLIEKEHEKVPIWPIYSQNLISNTLEVIRHWVMRDAHYSVTMAASSIPISYLESYENVPI